MERLNGCLTAHAGLGLLVLQLSTVLFLLHEVYGQCMFMHHQSP